MAELAPTPLPVQAPSCPTPSFLDPLENQQTTAAVAPPHHPIRLAPRVRQGSAR